MSVVVVGAVVNAADCASDFYHCFKKTALHCGDLHRAAFLKFLGVCVTGSECALFLSLMINFSSCVLFFESLRFNKYCWSFQRFLLRALA